MQSNYLFVYGSLLSGFKSPAYEYITRFFELISAATADATMYDLGDYPAVIPDNSGRKVTGELYRIRNAHELSFAMAQLDDYEGLNPEVGETANYRRELANISYKEGETTAWVYWFNHEISDKPVVASGNVLEYMKTKSHG